MCLEKKIEELTIAINRLTLAMSGSEEVVAPAPVATPAPAPVTPEVKPTPAPAPAPAPVAPPVPAPVAPVTDAPFNNSQELVAYVMAKYKQLGPEKGAMIQNVMTELGYTNINDIKPEHFTAFHQKIEAL